MDGQQTTAPEQVSQTTPRSAHRSARSKGGCLTCKRRKVKCDEQRPRCCHCERLNLECKWQILPLRRQSVATSSSSRNPVIRTPVSVSSEAGILPGATLLPPQNAVNQIFDYASFMWEGGEAWQQVAAGAGESVEFDGQLMDAEYEAHAVLHPPNESPGMSFDGSGSRNAPSEPSTVPGSGPQAGQDFTLQPPADNHRLMDYFIHAVTPPILAEVETQKQWFAMRQNLVKMANDSRMVRWALLAFANIMLCRRDGAWMASQQNHYDNAAAEVVLVAEEHPTSLAHHSPHRQNLLATLFFLSYVDLLEGRIEAAQSNLRRAYDVFQQSQKSSFVSVEKQLLLWTRLVDARAVSAGGEGLFLSKDDEALLVASPISVVAVESPRHGAADDCADGDIEDVLFQLLYQPGIMFFQKVQSFMGRISQIDPWHRARGSVDDETEVMNVGRAIAADIRTLYDQRPLLMDYAVAGKLTAPHVSAHLAFVITRAFRTYLSNYYASKIHLHRVAYKMFPLTAEASDAVSQIRRLAMLITEGLDSDDALPVNMLWPLLMLGSEEQDPEERQWINTQIVRMEKVAGNAKITAQVLEEVQARQDSTKMRVDIRSVMHAIFNSSFAIV